MNNKLLVRQCSLRVTAGKHPECNDVILYGSANTPCVALDRCSRRASTSPITHRDVENTDIAWSKISAHELVSPASIKSNATHQSGAILIISLIMLLLLMLIGAAGMQTTMLEEKMAGNMRDKSLAFQAAESALKTAEASLNAALPTFSVSGAGGFYSGTSTIPAASEILKTSFWTTNPVATYTGGSLNHIISAPRYIIEELPIINSQSPATKSGGSLEFGTIYSSSSYWYRITARGTGGSDNAVVILQSIYRR